MPIGLQESHRPLPDYQCRRQPKFIHLFLKCVIMMAVISLFLFFLGFAAIILLHFLLLSNTFSRRCNRLQKTLSDGESPTHLLPDVLYCADAFPGTSDCAICLDSFVEGIQCRNLPNCKHMFHARCVDKWIGKKPNCPVCRTQVDLNPIGSSESKPGGDDRWKRLWAVDFEEGTSY